MDLFSEALVKEGVATEARINEIKQNAKSKSIVQLLLADDSIDDEKIAGIFTNKFSVPRAGFSDIQPEALERFTKDNAIKYLSMPFEVSGRQLKVAMADPLDFNSAQEISFITGRTVMPHVASKTEILNAIRTCYESSAELSSVLDKADALSGLDIVIEDMPNQDALVDIMNVGKRVDMPDEADLEAPAIKLANLLIKDALKEKSSDIHIEPGQNSVNVRFRVDGILKIHTQFPKWIHSALVSRLKIMSKLDISNRRTPQDGSIKLKVDGNPLDMRVSTLPTHLGEKMVIRLLGSAKGGIKLSESGLDKQDIEVIVQYAKKPQGIILVTGPTGSGKTTTLHGLLKEIHTGGTNIITVEDPVEYELQGITQVQVNEQAGLTFANTLRSILRQDPDVVMVGEIRDLETAEIALRASMTGHLVLSTLHTNSTAATITRLLDLGVEPYLISSSLQCVIAQRLIRLNCKHCTEQYSPDSRALEAVSDIAQDAVFKRGTGCSRCRNTGFSGRAAIVEVMAVSPSLQKMISQKASAVEINETAKKEGMRTLFDAAMDKAYKGLTSLDEVLRVVSADEISRTASPVESPASVLTDAAACKGCSEKLENNWKFCPFCGVEKQEISEPQSIESPRVLIVDDEAGILKMVEIALRPLKVEVQTSQNGREALQKAQGFNPNLVITDINMPVMDGYDLIKELRKNVNTMFIPIIILSSRDTAEDKLKGFTYGTDDYITKPFDYVQLQNTVKKLLEKTYG